MVDLVTSSSLGLQELGEWKIFLYLWKKKISKKCENFSHFEIPYLMNDIIRLQKGLVKTVIKVPQNNIEQDTASMLEFDIKKPNIINEIKDDDKTTIASRHKM